MRAVAQADRGAGAADFLDRHDVFEIAEPQPAPLFFDGDAVEPQRPHLRPKLAREAILGIDRRRKRCDPVIGEARGGVADQQGIFAEAGVEIWSGAHWEGSVVLRPTYVIARCRPTSDLAEFGSS